MNGAFSGNRPVGSAVEPCPLLDESRSQPVHWVEIQLIGEDDKPIPGMEYKVVLPSGDEATGYLDEQGLARVEGIGTPGMCRVSFPELDMDAWEPVSTIAR